MAIAERFLSAFALASISVHLAACGSSGEQTTTPVTVLVTQVMPHGKTPSLPSPETATAAATRPAPVSIEDAGIGTIDDMLVTEDGGTLSVFDMEEISGTGLRSPSAGRVWISFDVQGCAGQKALFLAPYYYALYLNDLTPAKRMSVRDELELPSLNVDSGSCLRGWVTFEVPDCSCSTYGPAQLDSLRFNNFSLIAKWIIN